MGGQTPPKSQIQKAPSNNDTLNRNDPNNNGYVKPPSYGANLGVKAYNTPPDSNEFHKRTPPIGVDATPTSISVTYGRAPQNSTQETRPQNPMKQETRVVQHHERGDNNQGTPPTNQNAYYEIQNKAPSTMHNNHPSSIPPQVNSMYNAPQNQNNTYNQNQTYPTSQPSQFSSGEYGNEFAKPNNSEYYGQQQPPPYQNQPYPPPPSQNQPYPPPPSQNQPYPPPPSQNQPYPPPPYQNQPYPPPPSQNQPYPPPPSQNQIYPPPPSQNQLYPPPPQNQPYPPPPQSQPYPPPPQ
ncbi:11327_t:CDS:2, partial [Acaulospora morrowiae]